MSDIREHPRQLLIILQVTDHCGIPLQERDRTILRNRFQDAISHEYNMTIDTLDVGEVTKA
jgi:hypothetical protein